MVAPPANGHDCHILSLMSEFSSFGIKALFHVKGKTLFTHHMKLLPYIPNLVGMSLYGLLRVDNKREKGCRGREN